MASQSSVREQRSWVAGLLVFLAALAVYAPTVSDRVNTDVATTALTSWQIAHTGKPWMEGLDLWEDRTPMSYFGPGVGGHTVTTRTPGPIWAGVPFYLGSSSDQSDLDFKRGGLAAATMGAGAVALMFLALRTRMTQRGALGVAAVFAFATPMWSVGADALWTHAVTALGIAGAAWAASRERWWSAGAWFGIAILGRAHVAIIAAILGLAMAVWKRSPLVAVRVGVTSAVGMATLLVWNRSVFGVWDVRSGYGAGFESLVPGTGGSVGYLENLAGFLVSPDRGFLVWTPLALLLLPAVVRKWREVPVWSRRLAIGGVVYALVQMELNIFSGGDTFYGYRHGIELLVCITPLYGFALSGMGRLARWLAPVILGIQLAAIALGSVINGIFLHESQFWSDNSAFAALRVEPVGVGLFLIAFATTGAVLARRWPSWAAHGDTLTAGNGPQAGEQRPAVVTAGRGSRDVAEAEGPADEPVDARPPGIPQDRR